MAKRKSKRKQAKPPHLPIEILEAIMSHIPGIPGIHDKSSLRLTCRNFGLPPEASLYRVFSFFLSPRSLQTLDVSNNRTKAAAVRKLTFEEVTIHPKSKLSPLLPARDILQAICRLPELQELEYLYGLLESRPRGPHETKSLREILTILGPSDPASVAQDPWQQYRGRLWEDQAMGRIWAAPNRMEDLEWLILTRRLFQSFVNSALKPTALVNFHNMSTITIRTSALSQRPKFATNNGLRRLSLEYVGCNTRLSGDLKPLGGTTKFVNWPSLASQELRFKNVRFGVDTVSWLFKHNVRVWVENALYEEGAFDEFNSRPQLQHMTMTGLIILNKLADIPDVIEVDVAGTWNIRTGYTYPTVTVTMCILQATSLLRLVLPTDTVLI
ncbi:hypothetical protein BCR34DRAFT_608106 [Clohesyomyces aquaticus]|uniref:F-box domain-containing protein n=1 Tax=Clohesyomyces aquaticus TaxID=1231657 RepID=A0A1Y1YAG6_9PLEO|nr:hypothetical protein BCR34DRAFT_608106 [Clohesyomyces aquaticus]